MKMTFLQKKIFRKETNQQEIGLFRNHRYNKNKIFNNNKQIHNQMIFLKKRKYNKEIKD